MISVEGLSVEFNATPLFEDVSYVINKKDRIALVGKNGAGKSTMLKILAGLQSPTRGVVATPKDVTIGYLPQVMILSDNRTVMGEAELAFEHIFELQAKLERMNQELAERTDYDSEEYHQLIDRFTHENDRFLMMGGTNFQAEIERTLLGLGFSREDFERPTAANNMIPGGAEIRSSREIIPYLFRVHQGPQGLRRIHVGELRLGCFH